MANLKNITELPLAESAEGLNLIVNDNGAAKQIAAGAVGAQADWAETDETSPAFVKNKPVEEWDLDVTVLVSYNAEDGNLMPNPIVNDINFYTVKSKIVNGISPKVKIIYAEPAGPDESAPLIYMTVRYMLFIAPEGMLGDGAPEAIIVSVEGMNIGVEFFITSDGSVTIMG